MNVRLPPIISEYWSYVTASGLPSSTSRGPGIGSGVTRLDDDDAGPLAPEAVFATTVNEYELPLVRPVAIT